MQTKKDPVIQATRRPRETAGPGPSGGTRDIARAGVDARLGWWTDAVEKGGRGDYAAALAALDGVVAGIRAAHGSAAPRGVDAAVLSLCLSTRASLLRQGGRHDRAIGVDGRALAVVADVWPDPESGGRRFDPSRAAVADALVGLAADNLGLLRFGASRRLLERARGLFAGDTGNEDENWLTFSRCRLRWEWVSAELGLYSGDVAAGLVHAEAGAGLVGRLSEHSTVPVRHRVKTELILAAAEAGMGRREDAVARARHVVVTAGQEGLLPLEWAAWSLLSGLGDVSPQEEQRYGHLRATLVGKGMPLRSGDDG